MMSVLPLDFLRLDGHTQARETIHQAVVNDYAAALEAGATFPAVVAFFDGTDYWLGDGFHRALANRAAGRTQIAVEVHAGTREDAIWYAAAANRTHGLRRSNADKRRAVEMALASSRAAGLSDRMLAAHVGVSHNFVGEVRRALQLSSDDSSPRLGRDGKARVTSSAKRSEAAKHRQQPPESNRTATVLEDTPNALSEPKAATALPLAQPRPAPLSLSLFEVPEPVRPSRARRPRPYRRVLGAALAMSAAQQRQLLREIRARLQEDSKKWLPSPTGTSSGDGRGGAR